MVWHDRNSGGSRKGARDAHDLGKERRQKFYKGAKIISQYRKAVKDAEKDGSSLDLDTQIQNILGLVQVLPSEKMNAIWQNYLA